MFVICQTSDQRPELGPAGKGVHMQPRGDRRQELVLSRLRELGTARLVDLAEEFGVSAVTLRRDATELEGQGALRRTPEMLTASAARNREGCLIGLVLPNTEYYFTGIIEGAQAAATAAGARLVVATSGYDPAQDRAQSERLLADGADALILIPSWATGEPGPASRWYSPNDGYPRYTP
jgi:hypothetical protein